MINYKQALELAESYVRIISEDKFVVRKEQTIKKPYGWIFFYQSREYLASGRFSDKLAGNAPFLIERVNNEIRVFGTAGSLRAYVAKYEAELPATRLQMSMPEEP